MQHNSQRFDTLLYFHKRYYFVFVLVKFGWAILPKNAGVEALSLERSSDGGCITFFKFGNVTVNVGAGSP